MKRAVQHNKKLVKLKEYIAKEYFELEKMYDEYETVSAPSGEWAEYNIEYLELQSRFFAFEEMYSLIK